ncbi:MAG: HAMP domain-containing histidine kinase, partial [Lachnospiraceae bacterium]|nr:HAMP domain-containing histidine kinase [Lachnospiraceae bacterium]
GIRVICELLEVKVEDAYVRGKIENIRRKTDEMNVLLTDLLSSALDDLGELNVHVAEVTSDVISRLVEEHDTKKKVSAGKAPDCILLIDQNRLSQVIGNIIGNSYKYADTEIDVTYGFKDHYLEMTIRDHGEGAPEEELPLLTNKFYRGKKRAADKEGSGLGLYISSELMKKMKGQLILSSGEGFAVMLLLPLA